MTRSRPGLVLALAFACAVSACGDDDDASDRDSGADGLPFRDAGADPDAATADPDAGADAGTSPCPRRPAEADRDRWVLVAHPYDTDAHASDRWEGLRLLADGTLERPGVTFDLGRSLLGTAAFTPDGVLAFAVHDDGTVGVVALSTGEPVADPARVGGDFYAEALAIDPDGDAVWILDPNWRNNGGGLFRAPIECDDSVGEAARVEPSKLLRGLVWLPDGHGVAAAADLGTSAAGDSLHLFGRLQDTIELQSGANAFGDDEAIVSALAATADGRWALVGDNSAFSGIPNRIAAVEIDALTLRPAQTVDVEDPMAIVPSPFGGVVLVASGFGDALFSIALDPDAAEPLGTPRELDYSGARPALPAGAVLLDRGAQRGLVLVAENVGVRRVRFGPDGSVTDLGAFTLGEGLDNVVGAIGLQP